MSEIYRLSAQNPERSLFPSQVGREVIPRIWICRERCRTPWMASLGWAESTAWGRGLTDLD